MGTRLVARPDYVAFRRKNRLARTVYGNRSLYISDKSLEVDFTVLPVFVWVASYLEKCKYGDARLCHPGTTRLATARSTTTTSRCSTRQQRWSTATGHRPTSTAGASTKTGSSLTPPPSSDGTPFTTASSSSRWPQWEHCRLSQKRGGGSEGSFVHPNPLGRSDSRAKCFSCRASMHVPRIKQTFLASLYCVSNEVCKLFHFQKAKRGRCSLALVLFASLVRLVHY